MKILGRVDHMGDGNSYTGFWWGILAVKTPLGRRRRKWEDNIKMDLQEVGCGVMDLIELHRIRKVGGHL